VNKINVMKFSRFGDSTSSRVEDKLKTIRLSCTHVGGELHYSILE